MSPMVYDVAVVGAGPAGCAAALRALQVNPEARVAAASAAGADLLHHRVRRLEERRDCVVIDDGLAARVVIGADGANGVVRRQLGLAPQRRATSGVAVRGYSRTAINPDALLIAV